MMICFLCKTLVNDNFAVRKTLQTPLLSLSLRPISAVSTEKNSSSFTVNYLINSCGFSPDAALRASNYVHLKTPEKPDSVLAFFKNHNFTDTQISSLLKRNPRMIQANPEKTLLPKFKFLYSLGISSAELAKILTWNPNILNRSLKNQIIPSFDFFKSLIPENDKIAMAFKRNPRGFLVDLEATARPNVEVLRELGVPSSNISSLLSRRPRTFIKRPGLFREIVEEVKRMGFDPMRMNFLLAVHALASMSKLTWKRKVEVYKKWNLSEKEILVAFGKCPMFMFVSENKIMAAMHWFVDVMGFKATAVLSLPVILTLSVEKRIVPRWSVVEVLLSRGLIKDILLASMFQSTEKCFVQKFVTRYEEEAPQLFDLYKEKLNLIGGTAMKKGVGQGN